MNKVICNKCNGIGMIRRKPENNCRGCLYFGSTKLIEMASCVRCNGYSTIVPFKCEKCGGLGRLDWIDELFE